VFNILLQILDDGRLTDSQGRKVDFKNTVVIMTSNIGGTFILEHGTDDWALVETQVTSALRQHFRPEFLNRIDDIIVFRPLGEEQIEVIIGLQLKRLEKLLAEKKLSIELSPAARHFLAKEGYDQAFGARPLKRAIQRLVQNPLALAVLEGRFEEGDKIKVDVGPDGQLAFTNVPGGAELAGAPR
jgi:ATP-dependent Clp protease ATP-binding subunit ClpB